MAKILLGWEYGSGFGHIGPLLTLAQALKTRGHHPVIAVAQLEPTRPLWQDSGIEVIGAPALRTAPAKTTVPPRGTFADTIAAIGNFTTDRLVRLGGAWRRMLDQVRPDLVVCEFAPNLAFQSLGRLPTIAVGTGYTIPPAGRSLPVLRFWEGSEPDASSLRNEHDILASINAAASSMGLPAVEFVADLFNGDETFVWCLPELDCYRALRAIPAIGAIAAVSISPRDTTGDGLFAYLAMAPDAPRWLDGLAASGVPTEIYLRNRTAIAPPAGQVVLLDRPVDLPETLSRKLAVLHHGGISTAETALRLGVPQLVMPNHLEQRVTARQLADAGVGRVLERAAASDPQAMATAVRRLADPELQAAARQLALSIAARQSPPALGRILAAIARHI